MSSVDINAVDAERTESIKAQLRANAKAYRQKHTWLRHQNLWGSLILLGSTLGMLGTGWLYIADILPWWLCIPIVAIFASIVHEIEHDLIHRLYFRKQPIPHNLMMLMCWLLRGSTINPWIRRHIHLLHHKVSGTKSDAEERGITNGERFSIRRIIMMADGMLATPLLRQAPNVKIRLTRLLKTLIAFFPVGTLHYALWYGFLVFHAANMVAKLFSAAIVWPIWVSDIMPLVTIAVVVWVAPNVLRSFCLHFVSSNMHYYGDVEKGNIVQQTQVLNPWWMWPFQLFCFNFGSTHTIHHFVVSDPFYLRQIVAKEQYAVLKQHGVRFNDLGTFRRANRYAGSN